MAESMLSQVKKLADSFGIPEWVWHPIMDLESGGDTTKRNLGTAQSPEDSRGLFQINVLANPQYANLDLYNPLVNAKIAFQDFISPVWKEASANTNLDVGGKAAYVWKEGIRPKWTEEKNKAVRDKAQTYYLASNKPASISRKIGDFLSKLFGGKTTDEIKQETEQQHPSTPPDPSKQAGGNNSSSPSSWLDMLLHPEKVGTSIVSKLTDSAVTIVLLIVGLILLLMVLKSMFLEGRGNPA